MDNTRGSNDYNIRKASRESVQYSKGLKLKRVPVQPKQNNNFKDRKFSPGAWINKPV